MRSRGGGRKGHNRQYQQADRQHAGIAHPVVLSCRPTGLADGLARIEAALRLPQAGNSPRLLASPVPRGAALGDSAFTLRSEYVPGLKAGLSSSPRTSSGSGGEELRNPRTFRLEGPLSHPLEGRLGEALAEVLVACQACQGGGRGRGIIRGYEQP